MSWPAPPEYTGEVASSYEEVRKGQLQWAEEHRVVEEWLSKWSIAKSVLDFPVGTGRFLPLYRDRGLQAVGVDKSGDMLRLARDKSPEAILVQGCLDQFPRKPVPYTDLGVCMRFANWVSPEGLDLLLRQFSFAVRGSVLLGICVGPPSHAGELVGGAGLHSEPGFLELVRARLFKVVDRWDIASSDRYTSSIFELGQ